MTLHRLRGILAAALLLAWSGVAALAGGPSAVPLNSSAMDFAFGSTVGTMLCRSSSGWGLVAAGSANQVLTVPSGGGCPAFASPAGGGNVSTSGSPVSGQIAQFNSATAVVGINTVPVSAGGTGAATAAANLLFAGPSSGSAAAPTFRTLVPADLPTTGIVRTDVNQGLASAPKSMARFNDASSPFEALARDNLAVNPRNVFSQANGANAVTASGYVTDQWTVGGTLGFSAAQVAAPFTSRPDVPNGLQVTVATAKSTLAAGDYCFVRQMIEGTRAKRLLFGLSAPLNLALGFTVKSSVAATLYVSVQNGAANRTYLSRYALTAGTETFVPLAVPGDAAGTWATGTAAGMMVSFTLATGTTYQGTAGSWQSSNLLGGSDQTNLFATANATFTISDLIALPLLTVPSDLTTLFPTDRLPLFARQDDEEFRLCRRYYRVVNLPLMQVPSANTMTFNHAFGEPMRGVPTVTQTVAGSGSNVSSGGPTNGGQSVDGVSFQLTASAAGGYLVGTVLTADARM